MDEPEAIEPETIKIKRENEIRIDDNKIRIEMNNNEIIFTLIIDLSFNKYIKRYKHDAFKNEFKIKKEIDILNIYNDLINYEYEINEKEKKIIFNGKEIKLEEKIRLTNEEMIKELILEIKNMKKEKNELEKKVYELDNIVKKDKYKINLINNKEEEGESQIFGDKFVKKKNNNNIKEKVLDESSNVIGKIFNLNINPNMINDEINENDRDISNDNIIQNINEIKISDINENKKEYDFNQNEIIYKNDEENKFNSDNDLKHEEEKDYSVENIQRKIEIIYKLLFNITDRIYYFRYSQTQINLNCLESGELDKILNKFSNVNGAYEIILMNEDKYRAFNEMYNLDELKNILISYKSNQKEERKNLLEKNKEKFKKILNRIKSNKFTIDNIFQLNDDYEACINNINQNKKFALLSA